MQRSLLFSRKIAIQYELSSSHNITFKKKLGRKSNFFLQLISFYIKSTVFAGIKVQKFNIKKKKKNKFGGPISFILFLN